MELSVRRRGTVNVVQLNGPLRLGPPVDAFRQAIEEAFAANEIQLVVDLADVAMIDSSGIGALVRAMSSAKQRGGAVKLVNPSKFAEQTLRLVGVLGLFEVFDSDDAAVQSFA